MSKREGLNRDYSEDMFTRNAMRVHPKNNLSSAAFGGPMRGGIRL